MTNEELARQKARETPGVKEEEEARQHMAEGTLTDALERLAARHAAGEVGETEFEAEKARIMEAYGKPNVGDSYAMEKTIQYAEAARQAPRLGLKLLVLAVVIVAAYVFLRYFAG